MKMVVTGGGTGGHLYPGISIAREFMRLNPSNEVLFIGTKFGLEREVVPREGFNLRCLMVAGLKGKSVIRKLYAAMMLPFAVVQSLWILLRFRPAFVMGVGGYASFPASIAAWVLRIPVYLQEQNAIPGLANRLLGRIARYIFVAFDDVGGMLPQGKAVLTGNPIRPEFMADSMVELVTDKRFTVLVFGGSQGASAINRAVAGAIQHLGPYLDQIHWIHQIGRDDMEPIRKTYEEYGCSYELHRFLHDMPDQFRRADIVIARAGASTIAELTVTAKPAILIPYPHAIYDHQTLNARALERAGAAIVVAEGDLTGEGLAERILVLQSDESYRKEMAKNSAALGTPGAARNIVNICIRTCKVKPDQARQMMAVIP